MSLSGGERRRAEESRGHWPPNPSFNPAGRALRFGVDYPISVNEPIKARSSQHLKRKGLVY